MVKFYYALVDDLISEEEFHRRVEDLIRERGDLIDEHAAAMLVVRECGRYHAKIRDISPSSTLACFFGKVIGRTEPKEFDRSDGSRGIVASCTVGDDTGTLRVVLWDEHAAAVGEIEDGDVLEILGRPKGEGTPEVHAAALRKSVVDISCTHAPPAGETRKEGCDVEIVLLSRRDRTFTKKDGTPGEMAELVVGNEQGVYRMVCWEPALLEGIEAGTQLRITAASERDRDGVTEYSLGEGASVMPLSREITIPLASPAGLSPGDACSIRGTVTAVHPPRPFTTKRGDRSWVRNLIVSGDGGTVRAVLWGDLALRHVITGETIEIYQATAKSGRFGDLEVHAGRGSAVLVAHNDREEEISVNGTVVPLATGLTLDSGHMCYLLEGDLPVGAEVAIEGTVRRKTITPRRVTALVLRKADVAQKLERLAGSGTIEPRTPGDT